MRVFYGFLRLAVRRGLPVRGEMDCSDLRPRPDIHHIPIIGTPDVGRASVSARGNEYRERC